MTRAADPDRSARPPKAPMVTISVENFGPIEHGKIDLRPMNIFVGPSNTGKTWFAVLIYALHRMLDGFFDFLPVMAYLPHEFPQNVKAIQKILDKLNSSSGKLLFSDLDEEDRENFQSIFTNPEFLGNSLRDELERCFDLDAASDLIRMSKDCNEACVSLKIEGSAEVSWNFHMSILSNSDIHTNGKMEDFDLKRVENAFEKKVEKIFSGEQISDFFTNLSREMERPDAHYLPADRSGIMHTYRVVASSLIQRAARADPAPPGFSGVMADFMQGLVHYDESNRRGTGRRPRTPVDDIADALERDTLSGRIRAVSSSLPGGFPAFVYRPRKAERDIRLTQASSMVSELASVVLLVRGGVRAGDTLLIDEPEAHLHPAAQTEMATFLARLARAGVRVVITTHSDWLLQEIGNLMRAGALSEAAGESEAGPEGSLRPRDVGVWLFDSKEGAGGSTIREIPFDFTEGVQPRDYEDVAERLYNRSANLQDGLEEAAARGKKGG